MLLNVTLYIYHVLLSEDVLVFFFFRQKINEINVEQAKLHFKAVFFYIKLYNSVSIMKEFCLSIIKSFSVFAMLIRV